MVVAILGTGFVAQAYARSLHYLGYHPIILSRSWWDYTNHADFRFFLKSAKPDWVINCAGFTGESVDDVELDYKTSSQVNWDLPMMIGKACEVHAAKLIHISTGCMFMGGPFNEADKPNFLENNYQRHKKLSEDYLLNRKTWIYRIRMPFSEFPHPRNWLCKLEKYPKVMEGLNSVTWIDEFAMRSWQLSNKAPHGIYHATQPGPVWTSEIAQMLAGKPKPRMTWDELQEFHRTHVYRSAAVLSSHKFENAYGAKGTSALSAIEYCIGKLREKSPRKTTEAVAASASGTPPSFAPASPSLTGL